MEVVVPEFILQAFFFQSLLRETPLLDQATSKPKMLEMGKPIPPGRVLDAIERDLAKGRPFCFPTAQTKLAQVMRRLVPGLVWSTVHRVEGR